MGMQIDRVHQTEDTSKQCKEEIAELQKALSDSHLAIYDERSQFLVLKREYDALLMQERNDQKKI